MTQVISIMTYNVHSCMGTDGAVSPMRIADVIRHHKADIIALQELDCGLARTGGVDQVRMIAEDLGMSYHFHPTLRMEKGHYGIAILSRYRLRLVKAEKLPTHARRPDLEKRGALWVEIDVCRFRLQVITTHLGLNRHERLGQAEALLSPEWLGNPACRPPFVFCGDLNTRPGSPVCRRLKTVLLDAQICSDHSRPQKTWPSRAPLMRLDYVWVTPGLKVQRTEVPRNPMTRRASDHLPLIVHLCLPG